MSVSRRIAAVVLGVLTAGALSAAPASAEERFADSSVSANNLASCQANDPCDLIRAINGAGPGADVSIAPGNPYNITRLETTLQPPSPRVVVHGQLNISNLPVIISDAPQVMFLSQGQQANRLELHSVALNSQGLVVGDGSAGANQIYSQTEASNSVPCEIYGVLRNSVCFAKGTNSSAVETRLSEGLAATPTLRNVTAYGAMPDSTGIYAEARDVPKPPATGTKPGSRARPWSRSSRTRLPRDPDYQTSVTVNATNVIAQGGTFDSGGSDAWANSVGKGSTAKIKFTYSNYFRIHSDGSGSSITPAGTEHNTFGSLQFVDPAKGDFREQSRSGTIGAGITADANGPADLDFHNRSSPQGSTDIGAYQFLWRLEPPGEGVSNAFFFGGFESAPGSSPGKLAVTVPAAGTLAVHDAAAFGSSPVAKRGGAVQVRVKAASAEAGGAGTVELTIRPAHEIEKLLAKRGHLHARVGVIYTPVGGEPVVKLRSVTFVKK